MASLAPPKGESIPTPSLTSATLCDVNHGAVRRNDVAIGPIAQTQCLDQKGNSPFADWFNALDAQAAVKVSTAQTKLGLGNWSNVKGVGGGVYERVIDFGPGYRIYFGKDGDKVVILLAGGTKKRQDTDIINAKERWQDYKQRKKSEK